MSWACGAGFHFMQLERALRAQDFSTAARECTISEAGNPGIIPRNKANRILYRNAAAVLRREPELDRDSLYWPVSLPDETPTAPRLPADTEPDTSPARITGTEEALRGEDE